MNQNIRFYNKPSNNAGFTFVELIITILVLGIMASLAIYNGSRITSPHKKSLALQQVIDDINYARTLAISTNELITIEFSDSMTITEFSKDRATFQFKIFQTELVELWTF